jgi:hypothetical protein
MDPITFLIEIAIIVVLTVALAMLAPKPKITDQRPASLGEFQFPTATEGRSLPLVWGTVKVPGSNVCWYGDLKAVPITKKIKTGLFSSKEQVLGYEYFLGIQFAICRGTVDLLTKVWVDDKLVFSGSVAHRDFALINKPFLYGGPDQQGGVKGHLRLLAGDRNQGIDGYLDSALDHSTILTTPAYRGTSYIMWSNNVSSGTGHELKTVTLNAAGSGYSPGDVVTLAGGTSSPAPKVTVLTVGAGGSVLTVLLGPNGQGIFSSITGASNLTQASVSPAGGTGVTFQNCTYEILDTTANRGPGYLGNSTQIKAFAFEVVRIPNGLALGSGHETIQSADANPMNVIYEILTDPDWGLGFAAADIDTTVFSAAADVLFTEDNGFSMILDSPSTAGDLIKEIERQIEGIVFVDRTSGKWTIKLVRADYTLGSMPAIDETNIKEVRDFARSSWQNTKNNIQIPFVDRAKSYKQTYAIAQDVANMSLQGGLIATVSEKYPGVMSRTNATRLAWRGLKNSAYPLAKATFVLDRTLHFLNPGDVVRWSDTALSITDMAMRITRVDLGRLDDGVITVDAIQDVFAFEEASMGEPTDTTWVDPATQVPVDIPSNNRAIFEAPKAFVDRAGGLPDRIWAGARNQGDGTTAFDIWMNPNTTAYSQDSEVQTFFLIGKLTSAITPDNTPGVSDVTVTPDPDVEGDILDQIISRTTTEIGVGLLNLCLVDNEFIGFTTAVDSGGNIVLTDCYRGLMDTVPASHAINAKVYFISMGGNISAGNFVSGDSVDVKLLTRGPYGTLDIGDATATTIVMADRYRKPYPPNTIYDSNFDPEATPTANWESPWPVDVNFVFGSTTHKGIAVGVITKFFGTTNEVNSSLRSFNFVPVMLISDDEISYGTQEQLYQLYDTTGTAFLINFNFSNSWTSGQVLNIERTRILRNVLGTDAGEEGSAALPTSMRMLVSTRHTRTQDGASYQADQDIQWDFPVTFTELSGLFIFLVTAINVISATYTATNTGTHTVTRSWDSLSGTNTLQVSVNGAAFATVITGTATSGTFSATSGQTIRFKSTAGTSIYLYKLSFSGTDLAFGIID